MTLLWGLFTEALPIDVYHFLVQYQNGRIAEKIAVHSAVNYRNSYQGYVANVVLLNRREYSLQEFIQEFGLKNYYRYMTGYFGFGLEERIMFDRNMGGLDADPHALPPPDGRSEALAKRLKKILHGEEKPPCNPDQEEATPLLTRVSLTSRMEEPETLHIWSLREEGVDLPSEPIPACPEESDERRVRQVAIEVYRFLAEYINGTKVEKTTTQPPDQYQKRYKGYVKRVALLGKESYTARKFKETFGEKNYNLLVQGLFGRDDTDVVMDNRISRGLPPYPDALPAQGQ